MRIYNRYLFFMVLATCVINVAFALVGQKDIAVYFITSVIAFLLITLLFIYFSPRTRKALSVVSIVFLAGFIVVGILKVIEVMKL